MLLLAASCGTRPSYVIKTSKMANIIADLHVAEAAISSDFLHWGNDSARMAMKQMICVRNGVTVQDLDTSLVWYGRHLDKYTEIYDKAHEIIEKKIAKAEKEGGQLQLADNSPTAQSQPAAGLDADSINLYQGVKTLRISENMPAEIISFNYRNDRDWERGDIFSLNTKMIGTRGMASMDIAVDYADGTTEYLNAQFGQPGKHSLILVLDSTKMARNVYGSLFYHPSFGEIAYIDSISVSRTRNHDDNKTRRERFPSKLIRSL